MATQTYMTAKLNLADGTIVYPQISLDNIVKSISDPTLVTVATLDGSSKVSINNLPVTTSVTDSNSTVPTNGAVYGALNTKQNTLVEGDNIIHIIGGSTIMADITNLDVAGIDQTATNGVYLVLDGNTISAAADLAATNAAGVIAGGNNSVAITNGVIQGATPEEIRGGTGSIVTAEQLQVALYEGWKTEDILDPTIHKSTFNGCCYELDPVNNEIICGGTVGSEGAFMTFDFWQPVRYLSTINAKWIVTCEVWNNTPAVPINLGIGEGGSIITGVPTRTSSSGTWERLAIAVDTTTQLERYYLRWQTANTTAGTVCSWKIRNVAFINANALNSRAKWAEIVNNPGELYKSGAGIRINCDTIGVDEASVEDIVGGDAIGNKTITPRALQGAFSAGKAVDVTCTPYNNYGTLVNIIAGVVQTSITDPKGTLQWSTTSALANQVKIGFYDTSTHAFPAYAESSPGVGLYYLLFADIKNTGTTNLWITTGGTDTAGSAYGQPRFLAPGKSGRFVMLFHTKDSAYFQLTTPAAGSQIEITNMREYEVNGCSDAARAYIGSLPNPDDFNAYYAVGTEEVNPWIPIINMKSSPSTTIASGLDYKLLANDGATHTLTVDTCPTGYYGRDAHMSLFVGATDKIQVEAPLVLMQPLTANAVNNCTIKFRDGEARMYVDDTAYGYTVILTSGTDNGSLNYGIWNSTAEYITFSAVTDGQDVLIDSGTISRNMNVLGNGPENTKITGGTVKFYQCSPTFNNLTVSARFQDYAYSQNPYGWSPQFYNCLFVDVNGITTSEGSGSGISLGYLTARMYDCEITGCTSYIFAKSPFAGLYIQNCWFHDNSIVSRIAIGRNCTVKGSTFSDACNGIWMEITGGTMTDCVFPTTGTAVRALEVGTKGYYASTTLVSGSTFGQNRNIAVWNGGTDATTGVVNESYLKFSGTNYIDSTIDGSGRVSTQAFSTTNFGEHFSINLSTLKIFEISAGSTLNNLRVQNNNNTQRTRIMQFYGGTDGIQVNNAIITGNTNTNNSAGHISAAGIVYFTGSTIANNVGNSGYGLYFTSGSRIYFDNVTYGDGSPYCESNVTLTITGNLNLVSAGSLFATYIYVKSGAVITTKDNTKAANAFVLGHTISSVLPSLEDNVSIVYASGTTATVDAMEFGYITKDGTLMENVGRPLRITGSTVDTWTASKAIFGTPVDGSEAATVKLSGSTLTGTSTLTTRRIQLPASTTINIAGNSNVANTKILQAGLIVVGNDPASPSGSASVVTATGTTAYSGIGTYIDKEGDSDFVAANKVVSVSTDAAFATALTATTGSDGTNRFIEVPAGSAITAAYADTTAAVNKNVMTADFEPVIGGTWSMVTGDARVDSETVSQTPSLTITGTTATWTGVLQFTGNCVVSGVMDGRYQNWIDMTSGASITGGTFANMGIISHQYGGFHPTTNTTLRNVTITNDSYVQGYGYIGRLYYASNVLYDNCRFLNAYDGGCPFYISNGHPTFKDCYFSANANIHMQNANNSVVFSSTNKFLAALFPIWDGSGESGTVTLADNSVLDIRDNAHSTVLKQPGGIIFGNNVKIFYNSNGTTVLRTATISGATVTSVSNTGTLGTTSNINGSFSSLTLTFTDSLVYVNSITLASVTLSGGWIFLNDNATMNLSGNNDVSHSITYSDGGTGNKVTFAANTTLRIRTANSNWDWVVKTNDLTIGANCKIILPSGSTVSLNGGVAGHWTTAQIKTDGTITGTPA